jgi:hypothetical protein
MQDVSQLKALSPPHWLINKMNTKAKCRHLKNWPVNGLCDRCLSEFIDTVSHVGIFDPALWTVAFLTCLVHPPPPSLRQKYIHVQTMYGWERVGRWWVLLETIFCRSLTLCIWPDWEPTKLLDRSKQKLGGERAPAAKSFTGQFFWCRHYALVSL